jgi:hypothetical protein
MLFRLHGLSENEKALRFENSYNDILKNGFKTMREPSRLAIFVNGVDNIIGPPMFVGKSAGNYRIRSDSMCINTGTNMDWMVGALDLDGNSRLVDGRVDIGAYEYDVMLSDSDGDRVSDNDEIVVYGSSPIDPDTDGDGMLDGDEDYAGTDLTNRLDVLAISDAVSTPTNMVMKWPSVNGKVYSVWVCSNLVSASWVQVGGVVISTPPNNQVILPPMVSKHQFYKIHVE